MLTNELLSRQLSKHVIESHRRVTPKNVKYGMLVEVLDKDSLGYHAGCKVHFFNNKGVLVGNLYEFLPYERLRLREPANRYFPRYFYGQKYQAIKCWLYLRVCGLMTRLMRFAERFID